MLKIERKATAPGDILKAHYLEPRGITITEFAEVMGCSRKHLSNVVNNTARMEAGLASKIAIVFDTTPQFWMNLQNAVDIENAKQEIKSWKPSRIFAPVNS